MTTSEKDHLGVLGSLAPEAVQITQAVILSSLHHHTNTVTYLIIPRQSLPIPASQSIGTINSNVSVRSNLCKAWRCIFYFPLLHKRIFALYQKHHTI